MHREPGTNSPAVAKQLDELRTLTKELREIGAGTRAGTRLVSTPDGAFIRVCVVKGEPEAGAKP